MVGEGVIIPRVEISYSRAWMVEVVASASSAESVWDKARKNSPVWMSSQTSWARRWVERWVERVWEPGGMSRSWAQPPVRKDWQGAQKVASAVV